MKPSGEEIFSLSEGSNTVAGGGNETVDYEAKPNYKDDTNERTKLTGLNEHNVPSSYFISKPDGA
jgi:hypothetical protein